MDRMFDNVAIKAANVKSFACRKVRTSSSVLRYSTFVTLRL